MIKDVAGMLTTVFYLSCPSHLTDLQELQYIEE